MTHNTFAPLLGDIQNLIHQCNENERFDLEEQERQSLFTYSSGFCDSKVAKVTPVFDIYDKEGERTSKSSFCDCGFAHMLRGKEYDIAVKVYGIHVGLNRGGNYHFFYYVERLLVFLLIIISQTTLNQY